MFLSGYEVRAVIDDKQFAVLSSSRPFGRGSPKVRTTSARPGAMYSCSGRKKISSATPADVRSAIADRTTSRPGAADNLRQAYSLRAAVCHSVETKQRPSSVSAEPGFCG